MPYSSENYKKILDSINEGLLIVDKSFKVDSFNKAAEEITGYKKEEVIGQFCKDIFKCELCETKCPIGIILESGKDLKNYRSEIEVKEGIKIPIKLNASLLFDEDSQPDGGVISFQSLTELDSIKKNLYTKTSFYGIVGHSKVMQEIFELITEISNSDATVLIRGESGTGKELIANAIQASSKRKNRPFVKVNCSVFPENLLASELFGHVKGAFTDAIKDRAGRFELADGGTIFLDEVAEMPLQTQVKLLRVLQEGTFERVGESISRSSDIRVISATNIDVDAALKEGKLREDLYYRLNVIPVFIPPLRDRKEDIPYLVKIFIEEYSELYKKNITEISNDALDRLMYYSFPGNVRELENLVEYAVVRCKSGIINLDNFPTVLSENYLTAKNQLRKEFKVEGTPELIQVLKKHKWNKSKAAQELGISRTTLWRLLKDLPE